MNKKIPLLAAVVGTFAIAPMTQAKPLKLDFGTESSLVFQGFTRVSDKNLIAPDAQFGFVKRAPKAYDKIRPNALASDFVYSPGKSTFQVNLPNGKYKAWFLYGNSRYTQRVLVPLPMKYKIDINGKSAVADSIDGWQDFYTEKYFYRGYSYVYHNNDDFYAKYIAPNFRESTAEFEVTDKKVLFTLEDMPLNAMIIYPANEAAEVEDDIAYLHKELKRNTIINEVKPDNVPADPAYSANMKKQGYVTYSRYPTDPPLPTDRPLLDQINSAPSAFLARDQKANLSVSILPLKDLRNVKISVSDLENQSTKAKIPAANIDVQYIAQQEITADGKTASPAYSYKVAPTFIKPFPSNFDLMDKGINRTILLTVAANSNNEPGIYQGTLTITPQNAPAKKVLLKVRVLPFALPELPILAGRYAMDSVYYYNYYWSRLIRDDSFRDFVWEQQKKNMQWVKDMGLNSIAFSDDMRNDILTDPMRFDPDGRMIKWMDLYRDMGLKAMPWYGFQALTSTSSKMRGFGEEKYSPEWMAKYHQLIEYIRDEGKKRNWPEIVFYLSDELSNHGNEGVQDGLKRIAASDNIPGIRRVSSVNGPYEHALIGKEDAIMPNYAFPITDETVKQIKDSGSELWLYNVTDNRFTWGYYPFRTGAKARYQWYQSTGNCFPFDDFDSQYGDTRYSAFVAGPDGPISMVNALNMHDGLDDLRYLTLMQNLMKGKNAQSKGMKEANEILKEINELNVDLRTYANGPTNARETGFSASSALWSPEKCEKMRWRIAETIMKLQK